MEIFTFLFNKKLDRLWQQVSLIVFNKNVFIFNKSINK